MSDSDSHADTASTMYSHDEQTCSHRRCARRCVHLCLRLRSVCLPTGSHQLQADHNQNPGITWDLSREEETGSPSTV
jgi:hypothetical protein